MTARCPPRPLEQLPALLSPIQRTRTFCRQVFGYLSTPHVPPADRPPACACSCPPVNSARSRSWCRGHSITVRRACGLWPIPMHVRFGRQPSYSGAGMSRSRPVPAQSPATRIQPSLPIPARKSCVFILTLALSRRRSLCALGWPDRHPSGTDDHPRPGNTIHPGAEGIRGEAFLSIARVHGWTSSTVPVHLPRQAESGRLVSWETHRSIGNGATVSVRGHVQTQWRLPACRCAPDSQCQRGDSNARLAVPPPGTGSPVGRRCRSGPTGLHGRRPWRHGASPAPGSPRADTPDAVAGVVVLAAPSNAAGGPG